MKTLRAGHSALWSSRSANTCATDWAVMGCSLTTTSLDTPAVHAQPFQ
jgi:hypothetical protein